MLSLSRTTWSRRSDLMVLGTAKLKNRKSTLPSLQFVEEMSQKSWRSKRTLQRNSRSFSKRPSLSWITTQNWQVNRQWTSWHRKITRTVSPKRNSRDTKWYLTLNKSGKNAPMRLRSDFQAAVSVKNRLHQESGEEVAQPISPQQYRGWHHSSSSDSWWNWDTSKSWWSSWEDTSIQF